MQQSINRLLGAAVPRYTSYPTAPHFDQTVGQQTARRWLEAVPDGDRLSLYLHVPFCDRLCWFCACHTRQVLRYQPVTAFLRSLHREIEMVGALLGKRASVAALHLGGGSPTMLSPGDLLALGAALREAFVFEPGAEISVEIDPNDVDEARLDALAAFGLTRASLGIQDFDPAVQRAINREQGFELTRDVVAGLRRRGVGSVNIDLLYGLPHQTVASVEATVIRALTLVPDRIVLFGYAHVPWFKKHQTMIDETALPDAQSRLDQSRRAATLVAAEGYQPVGLDHFALPGDSLAIAAREGRLRRNFQGYTDDACETLLGLGPSSISRFRQGHAQNVTATGAYQRAVAAGGLAVARGIAFTGDDRLRGWVIERLMCDFAFDGHEALARFGGAARGLLEEADAITRGGDGGDAMLQRRGATYLVPEPMRPLVRAVAARFDRYLDTGAARHSVAV